MHCKFYQEKKLVKGGWRFMIIVYIGNVGYPDMASSIHVRNRGIFMKTLDMKFMYYVSWLLMEKEWKKWMS